jgi:SAM-dependent methyltransferase
LTNEAMVEAREHWREEASRWAAWARTPQHDAYWYYRDAFFALVPPPGRMTLEVGAGEGRVSRDLVARGHRVTGLDITEVLVRLAAGAAGGPVYAVADGAALPLRAASVDLAVAYNSLMDVDDLSAVVLELGRVVVPGGRLCVCITHPLADAGHFTARETLAPFVIEGAYLSRRPYQGTFERDGLRIAFQGWSYPLGTYSQALESGGFLVEALREPEPAADAPARLDRYRRIPNFLMLRAVKSAPLPTDPTQAPRPRRAA